MNQNNKKRILIFSTTYHPFVGGAEIAIKEITDRIDDIDFDMVTLRFDKRLPKFERVGNINIYRIGFATDSPTMSDLVKFPLKINKLLFPFLVWWKATDLHAEKQYDGIWAMMAAFAGFGAVFFKFTHPKVPYLLTLQEGDPIKQIKKKVHFVYPLFKKIFTKADMIQVISNYLGDWAKDMGGKNVVVVPNGVDLEEFRSENLEFRKKISDKIVLIHTGRLVEKNAIDDVIKSLNYLPKNIEFLQVGSGPDEEKLKNLAKDLGVENRVKFVEFVPQEELLNYLKNSDIFIRPSLSEGFGNSFVEAMAVGVSVIATQEGGIADFLFDAKRNPEKETTGWVVDTKNPKQIAEAVKDILDNPEKTKKVVENAKKMVIGKYDWNIVAKDMREKVFENIINLC
jgi:glycosyltransferase involved in cell wall biosynthesis